MRRGKRDLPLLLRTLASLVHPRWRDEIVGDLLEEHSGDGHGRGRGRSLRLVLDLLGAAAASRWQALRHGETGRPGPGGPSGAEGVVQDVRFALRGLRRSPVFAVVALVTLAAGTGLTMAVFAVVHAVLLRPLDYPEPDRLVLLQGQEGALHAVTMPQHLLFRDDSGLLEGTAAWQGWAPVMDDPDGTPFRRAGASVSAGFFSLVGVRPTVGRLFGPDDGRPGHEPAVVLSHALWTARFGGDPSVVDRLVELDGEPVRVVGVAPEGFLDPVARGLGFAPRDLWRADPPLFADARDDHGWVGFWSVGRMVEGASTDAVTEEMRSLLMASYPGEDVAAWTREFRAVTVREAVVEDARATLLVLLAAVAVVLVIACVNLANLLLSRATVRRGELAVRASLGAPRARLIRQLLTESVVLAVAGTALGLALATVAVRLLVALAGSSLPRAAEVGLGGTVLVFALGCAFATALLFGTWPAFRASAAGLSGAGRGGRLGSVPGAGSRRVLVVVETALAMVLLTGAGLLTGTLLRLEAVDPGFDAEGVVAMHIGLGSERFPTPAAQSDALARVEESLAAHPGVSAVGAITDLPLSGATNSTRIRREGDTDESAAARRNVLVRAVTPGYFAAMEVPVRRGRVPDHDDRPGAAEVAVVNEEFRRRFFPGEDPLGRRVTVRGVEREIVGVVADVREFRITDPDPEAVLYTPYAQEREVWMRAGMSLVVRTRGAPGRGPADVRTTAVEAEPMIVAGRARPLDALVEAQVRGPRFRATLILVFAGLAVLLAAVGLGGVVAYGVSQRVPEIGLRLALGAGRGRVQGMLLRETAVMTGAGVLLGSLGALVTGRVLAGFLFEVEPGEPGVLLGAAVLLLGVGLASGWLPARGAARVDPARTLRGDGGG